MFFFFKKFGEIQQNIVQREIVELNPHNISTSIKKNKQTNKMLDYFHMQKLKVVSAVFSTDFNFIF